MVLWKLDSDYLELLQPEYFTKPCFRFWNSSLVLLHRTNIYPGDSAIQYHLYCMFCPGFYLQEKRSVDMDPAPVPAYSFHYRSQGNSIYVSCHRFPANNDHKITRNNSN